MLRTRSIFLCILLSLAFFHEGHAQPTVNQTENVAETGQETDISSIEARIIELKADKSLDESSRSRLMEHYESALKQLKAAEDQRKLSDSFREAALRAPEELTQIDKELASTIEASKRASVLDDQKVSGDQLDNQIYEARFQLDFLKNDLDQWGRNLVREQNRPEQIRLDQRALQERLRAVEEEQRGLPFAADALTKARSISLRATENALQSNLNALQMELSSQPPRLQLLRARYDLAIAKVAKQSARLESLEKFLAENRESQATRYAKELAEALKGASTKHSLIQEVIQQNFQLGKEFRGVSENIGIATQKLSEMNEKAKQIEKDLENSKKKIGLAVLSPSLATLLREQRRLLPSKDKVYSGVKKLLSNTGEATLRQFEIEEKLQGFLDIDKTLQERLALTSARVKLPNDQVLRIRVELNLLLEEQKSLLLKLGEAYSNYVSILGEVDFASQHVAEVAARYTDFLDENLLWVKSSPPIDGRFLGDLANAAQWFFSPQRWWEAATSLVMIFKSENLLGFSFGALLMATLSGRGVIRTRIDEISELVGSLRTDRFRLTLYAISYTILQAFAWSAIVFWIGWLLNTGTVEFTRALGQGLMGASIPYFLLQTFYLLFRANGIAELHLKWREKSAAILCAQFRWLRFVGVPCAFFVHLTAKQTATEYTDSLGRLALIVSLLAMSIALGKILHPSHGALKYFLAEHFNSIIFKTRFAWYAIIVFGPLVIAGFAALGFVASAIELQEKLIATIRAVFIGLFLYQLVMRRLRFYYRQLALNKFAEKRQAEKSVKAADETGESIVATDPADIDIATINTQTTRVLFATTLFIVLILLWLVWRDLVSALAILDEWVVWHKTVSVDGVESEKPVTLFNLFAAIGYLLAALIAIRNLPGLMEVLIMNRFSIESGNRYAINQLTAYFLTAVMVVLVAGELGGQWEKLQWLIAALGVGLGFGLQEILANFVSGIILLFERPLRIGDIVTVGDISGTVTRIQIRATTITDWERRDLVIPNKTFITDQLINWTRTDNITRILIPIGISCDADPQRAHTIISEIVSNHPQVLKQPESSVFFVGFGENSLNFEIRLFVKEISNRLPVVHDLHMELNRELKRHGIEIPFPQRDIHVRSGHLNAILKQIPDHEPQEKDLEP